MVNHNDNGPEWEFETGDIVRFEYDGEEILGVVKYQSPEPRKGRETEVYSVGLPAGVNANGYTYVKQSSMEYVTHAEDFDPMFSHVDTVLDEHVEDTEVCGECGGEAVHVETRHPNSWINEASAFEAYLYECTECGGTGKRTSKGSRQGILAPPAEPDIWSTANETDKRLAREGRL